MLYNMSNNTRNMLEYEKTVVLASPPEHTARAPKKKVLVDLHDFLPEMFFVQNIRAEYLSRHLFPTN